MSKAKLYNWNPWKVFDGESCPFALLVLNSSISSPNKLIDLWNKAAYRVLVDGGANRWYKIWHECKDSLDVNIQHPDEIIGDLDSVDPTVLAFYKQFSKVKVTPTPDQDYTDFTKAIKSLTTRNSTDNRFESILAFVEGGAGTGRPDQVFANYESLFHSISNWDHPVFLISSKSIEWLLPVGIHKIQVPEGTSSEKLHCGLIPFLSSSRISTTGFRWNVTDAILEFGILVSTSNEFESGSNEAVVEVFNHPILFTLQTKPESPIFEDGFPLPVKIN